MTASAPPGSPSPLRILVTGASRGIGKHLALALAQRGATVGALARDAAALEALAAAAASSSGKILPLPADLSDDDSVSLAAAKFLAGGPCHVLVNNAGRCEQREFLIQARQAQRDEMEVNYWGALRMTRAVLPAMVQRRAGAIVNVSSLLGRIASPTTANYGATKAALEAWSYALRAELAPLGITVTAFTAPHTKTDSGRAAQFDGVRSLPVEYTVRELLRALEGTPRHYAASPIYRLLLRLAGWFPVFVERQVAKSARSQLRYTRALLAGEPLPDLAK